ncbi:hypothetical protein SAMN06296036_103101 [Pseudobacteriovorax antillogorgiicola]|uniref:Outer membrane protein beta-barrel domain-containing protein n=2 Tax=Pseudobacteriovorax antillogorgiicola TaxID=1513793 RepID=A0A1Y6BF58_9BACT|nr:hypothetical protein EDD56_103232 [Pseudobacteriovorax antillogorgiicola]SMF00469.1 hypothetical protein SAMN06296036_103101 [Pseudobacteriovorax antillogorgiicola]
MTNVLKPMAALMSLCVASTSLAGSIGAVKKDLDKTEKRSQSQPKKQTTVVVESHHHDHGHHHDHDDDSASATLFFYGVAAVGYGAYMLFIGPEDAYDTALAPYPYSEAHGRYQLGSDSGVGIQSQVSLGVVESHGGESSLGFQGEIRPSKRLSLGLQHHVIKDQSGESLNSSRLMLSSNRVRLPQIEFQWHLGAHIVDGHVGLAYGAGLSLFPGQQLGIEVDFIRSNINDYYNINELDAKLVYHIQQFGVFAGYRVQDYNGIDLSGYTVGVTAYIY